MRSLSAPAPVCCSQTFPTGVFQHPCPVSYTHLDVYKRQSLLGALYGGRVAAKSACEQADVVDLSCATQIDFAPASQISEIKQLKKVMQETCLLYTSDVYKRQG